MQRARIQVFYTNSICTDGQICTDGGATVLRGKTSTEGQKPVDHSAQGDRSGPQVGLGGDNGSKLWTHSGRLFQPRPAGGIGDVRSVYFILAEI